MFDIIDPKSMTDEALTEKIQKCRELLANMHNSRYSYSDDIGQLLIVLEDEMNERNQKKFAQKKDEVNKNPWKREPTYPINLGTVEGDNSGKKDNR